MTTPPDQRDTIWVLADRIAADRVVVAIHKEVYSILIIAGRTVTGKRVAG